jgi:hypothetical protein
MQYHQNQITEKQPYITTFYKEPPSQLDFFVLPTQTQPQIILPNLRCNTQPSLDHLLEEDAEKNLNLKELTPQINQYITDLNNYLRETNSNKYLNITDIKTKHNPTNEIASIQTAYQKFNGFKESTLYLNNSGLGFKSKVANQAEFTNQTPSNMLEYVLKHELVHALGYHTESGCDAQLSKWFMHDSINSSDTGQRIKYHDLSNLALRRSTQYLEQDQSYNS